ncbi:M23 family metallopeptidase [Antrihabitans sp. NCIMB 15449]|jgi:hypothetical protein|uniref:M23 family metallopeptidase n=1 Tax=Antrihabitans spumae TaxID=3373370 RepID=A0ABW7JHX0_9NOCA
MRRYRQVATVLFSLLLVAACSSSTSEDSTADNPDARTGPTQDEGFTPLIVSTLNPEPIPVKGSDGKIHVSYELAVLNSAPRDATITRIETLADGADGKVVAAIERDEVIARSVIVGDYPLPPVPAETIPAGRTMLLIVDDAYDELSDVPAKFVNRLSATFAPLLPGQAPFATQFGDTTTQIGIEITTSSKKPVVLGPPLTGSDWVAFNACCSLSAHRGALIPLGGRINAGERYAIDWFRADLTVKPMYDDQGGLGTFRGDRTRNESFLAFDQPILAVADGTVITAVNDVKDGPPLVIPDSLKVSELGGNRVVIDIGDGNYAFYAHIKQGSVTVKPGDKVTTGQEIARLGNTEAQRKRTSISRSWPDRSRSPR